MPLSSIRVNSIIVNFFIVNNRYKWGGALMEALTIIVSMVFYTASFFSFGSSTANFIFQLVIGTLLFFIFLYLRHDRRKQEAFQLWLNANRLQILTDKAYYYNLEITRETRFVRYDIAISFFLFSTRRQSRLFIKEVHFTPIHLFVFTFITLFFGWWSVPVGPIRTLAVLWKNITGGHRLSGQDLIN